MSRQTDCFINRHMTSSYLQAPIYHLYNSISYFLQNAYIINDHSSFRLIVLNHGRLLFDKAYKTLTGAKIAFATRFGWKKLWEKDTHPLWSKNSQKNTANPYLITDKGFNRTKGHRLG